MIERSSKPLSILSTAPTIVFIATMVAAQPSAHDQKAQAKKPNILFIAINDLNDWTDTLKGNTKSDWGQPKAKRKK